MQVAVFKKENDEQRVVFAEVYAPNIPDADNEFMDVEGVRKMAYEFMGRQSLDQIDRDHTNELVEGAYVVESFIVRKGDPDFIENAWVVGVHIPRDEDWAKIKNREWNGFSIEALVSKEVVEIEVQIPSILTGLTMKSEGHTHTFYVSYNDTGFFQGGITDLVEGHVHKIVTGTVTEKVEGHTHRFSHLDEVSLKELSATI